MGRLALKVRKYQIRELWSNHKEICRQVMLGRKNVDIAQSLGVSPVVVSYTKNSTLGKEKIKDLEAQRDADAVSIAQRIQELAPKALDLIEQVITDEEVRMDLRLKAAEGVLDRAGHGAPTKLQGVIAHAHYTRDELEAIKQRARSSGVMIDVSST